MPKKFTQTLDKLSSIKIVKFGVYFTAIILFFALILLPPILGIIIKWNAIQQILSEEKYLMRALNAVKNSFLIAFFVSIIDVIAGLPMAWLVARGKSRWLNVLDTLCDIPFIVPTTALGYSLFLFWSENGLSALFGNTLISPGWLLITLLHFTFSYPVAVRVIVGALLDYKMEYEQASRTLGAPPFIASRTVTLSIIKPSLIAAFILAFSRSLSETGATIMVAGAFENGPTFIWHMQEEFSKVNPAIYEGSIVFASFLLITISCIIFGIIRIFGPKLKLPIRKVWPSLERKLSYSPAVTARNTTTLVIFLAVVLMPSLFVALPAFQALFTDTLSNALLGRGQLWGIYWQSLILSYFLGVAVTIINVIIGLPMAILIARKTFGRWVSTMLDVLVNVPLIVPSIALGVSLKFFWKETLAFIPEMWLLIFAHLAITYPYFVRSMSAAVERISLDMEEAAKTLGAKPLAVFRTIILPLTKYSILSGAVMIFTRSVSETGATKAVTTLRTAPLVIVDVVPKPDGSQVIPATFLDIGLACGFLLLFSFMMLLALRLAVKGKGKY